MEIQNRWVPYTAISILAIGAASLLGQGWSKQGGVISGDGSVWNMARSILQSRGGIIAVVSFLGIVCAYLIHKLQAQDAIFVNKPKLDSMGKVKIYDCEKTELGSVYRDRLFLLVKGRGSFFRQDTAHPKYVSLNVEHKTLEEWDQIHRECGHQYVYDSAGKPFTFGKNAMLWYPDYAMRKVEVVDGNVELFIDRVDYGPFCVSYSDLEYYREDYHSLTYRYTRILDGNGIHLTDKAGRLLYIKSDALIQCTKLHLPKANEYGLVEVFFSPSRNSTYDWPQTGQKLPITLLKHRSYFEKDAICCAVMDRDGKVFYTPSEPRSGKGGYPMPLCIDVETYENYIEEQHLLALAKEPTELFYNQDGKEICLPRAALLFPGSLVPLYRTREEVPVEITLPDFVDSKVLEDYQKAQALAEKYAQQNE